MKMKSRVKQYDSKLILEELEARQLFSGGVEALVASQLENSIATYIDVDTNFEPTADSQSQMASSPVNGTEQASNEIVFIDPAVDDYQLYLDEINQNNTLSRNIEVVQLDPDRDGIEQISLVLAEKDNIAAIHIISTGNDGALKLGKSSLTTESLNENTHSIALWANAFQETGEIFVHGNDLAESAAGQSLIQSLSELTLTEVSVLDNSLLQVNANQAQSEIATKEIVIVDRNVANYQQLIDDITSRAENNRQFEIVMLDADRDGIAQITEVLSNRDGLSAVHLITHGSDGIIDFGSSQLNLQTLIQNQDAIKNWGNAFTENGDFLVYGCNVAETQFGQGFVDYLSNLIKTDVAASENVTGHAVLGGNWALEYQTGAIEAQGAMSATLQDQWVDVLAVTSNGTVTSTQSTNTTSLTWSHTVNSGSNRALFVQIAIDGLGANVNSVKYGTVDLTRVGRTAGNHAVEIWALVNPTVGTNNVVVTFSGNTAASAGASTFNGVNQSTPTGTYASASSQSSGPSTTASVNVSSAVGDVVIDAQYWQGAPTGGVAGTGQTLQWWQQNASLTGGSTVEAGSATVTMSGSFSSAVQWEIGAVSIKADTSNQISTTFQEGTNGYTGTQDTYLNKLNPNTSYGASVSLLVDDGSPNDQNSLIQFDNIFGAAAGKIPIGSTITNASLSIYVTNPDSLDQVSIYQMLSTWDENSTYNSIVNGVSPDGIEASNTALNNLDAGGSGVQILTGLASALQAWSSGATNHGWLIATATSSADNYTFDSSESSTISRRPMLSVTYTPPTPPSLDLDSNNSSGVVGSNFTGSFTEGGGAVYIVDTDATVIAGSNTISSNLSGMTVTISNLLDGNSESLVATTSGTNITASYNSGNGVLTLSGSDSAGNYQTVLRTITYNNSSTAPSLTSRVLNIVATDPYGGNSATAISIIAINAVNTLPTNTIPSAQTTNEDTAKVFSSANGNQISITDLDVGSGSNEITLTVTNGTLTLAGTTGLTFSSGNGTSNSSMTFRGTASAINTALNGLSYTPTSNYSGNSTLTLTTRDSILVSLDFDVNLQGRYTFENSANDISSGTAQNGTLINGATFTNDVTRGNVLSLDGVDDYVQISGTYSNPSEVTIGGWVNLASGTGRKEFISLSDRVHIALDDVGGVKGSIQTGASTWSDLNSGQFIAGTGWHHVMYTYSDGSNVHALYIDGVQVATATIASSVYWTGATDTFIGRHPTSLGSFPNAKIDDVRVYDRALSASEVANLAVDLSLTDTDAVAISVTAVNDAPSDLMIIPGIQDSDIIGIYSFSNSSNLGYDNAGNNAPITLYGSPTQTTGPNSSGALDLAGGSSGQYSDITGITTGGAMTFAASVRFDSTGDWQRVFDFGQTASSGIGNIYVAREWNTNNLTFTIEKTGTGGYTHRATANGAITNGTWLHFAATVDASGTMKLYVNGSLTQTTTGVVPETGIRTNNYIGKSGYTAGDALFDGAIDNFVVANGAMSAADVAALYQQTTGFSVVENAANGTVVGTVVGFDVDASVNPTYSLTDSAGGRFTIHSTNGTITVANGSLLDYESATSHSITVQVTDSVGASYTETFAVSLSNVVEATTAINLSASESFAEDTALNLTDIVITRGDSATVTVTLTLSNTSAGSLNTATSGAVSSTYNAGTGVWTASGAVVDVNTLLAGLSFTPATNFNSSFTIATSVSDGAATLTGTKTMTGSAVNDAPVNMLPSNTYTDFNTNKTFSSANGNAIQIADVDAASSIVQVTLSISNGTLTLGSTTGLTLTSGVNGSTTMTYTGTVNAINTALNAGITFTPANGFRGLAQLSLATSDLGNTGSGGALTDSDTLDIHVGAIVVTNTTDTSNGTVTSITNLIANNGGDGISLREAIEAAKNTNGVDYIYFNISDTIVHTINLTSPLSIGSPVIIDATSDDSFAANSSRPAIVLNGANAGTNAIELTSGSDGSTIRGFVIQNSPQYGIALVNSNGNTIVGNWIGLNASGTAAAANTSGISLWNSNNNIIGGNSAADRNVISGNTGVGIGLNGTSTLNQIKGNYIGTNVSGTTAIGNTNQGVWVNSAGNTIGGSVTGEGNVISGTTSWVGIQLEAPASNTVITGNIIGLNASGTTALGNAGGGIYIESSNNTIGGTTSATRNIISGNSGDGITIIGSVTNNTIIGNYIGTNAAGNAALGNLSEGITIDGAINTTIGGTLTGEGNIIAGSAYEGLWIINGATGTAVKGNWIGTDQTGTVNLGNAYGGIRIGNSYGIAANNNLIGGTEAGAGNIIAFNTQGGVIVDTNTQASVGNAILGNSIYSNTGVGIDLDDQYSSAASDGVTLNDAGDTDTGGNNRQNFPVITSAYTTGPQLNLSGSLTSNANRLYRVEFFGNTSQNASGHGEGKTYLGYTIVKTDNTGIATINSKLDVVVASGTYISATATDLSTNDTSEFALNITASQVNSAPTFSVGDGSVTTSIGSGDDWARAMAIQNDGKMIVAGYSSNGTNDDFALVRYNTDGSLDTTFGTAGKVTTAFGVSTDQAYAITVQPDGKIVVVGNSVISSNQDFAIARYNADGTLDTSFSSDGLLTIDFSASIDTAQSILMQADGKLIVGGISGSSFALVRINTDGSIDTSFGASGKVTTSTGSAGYGMALQTDGKILLAGTNNGDFAVVRYNANGIVDSGFGTSGMVTTDFAGGYDNARSVIVQSDGKILVGGYGNNGSNLDFALVRYNSDGTLDTSFSSDGKLLTDLSGTNDIAVNMAQQVDGKILLAGYDGTLRTSLVRYNFDGSVDTSFGNSGVVTTSLGSASFAEEIIVRSSGEIVVATTSTQANKDFAVLSYLPNGSLSSGFDTTTNTINGTPTYIEGGAVVILDSDVKIFDAELSFANFGSATLTLARHGAASSQDVFSATGTLSTLIDEGSLVVNGTIIGGVLLNAGGTLILQFNSSATPALVNSVLQQIAYSNTSDAPPAAVQIDWTFSDGNTGTQGTGGALTAIGSTTVTITAVNDAPSGTDKTVTATEDTTYIFSLSDFGISDTDGNAINKIWFDTLPSQGTLKWNGSAFTAGNFVNASDISLNLLTYVPANNAYGTGVASFTFRVQDDGGTANGGSDTDATANTITINITAVNDAPTATNLSAIETYIEDAALNLTDIVISDIDSATVTATLTLSNAAAGSLNTATSGAVTSTYNTGTGEWSASGAVADVNTLLAGLTFTPAANFNSSFTIATSINDGSTTLTGTKTMTGTAVNDAPTASNLSAAETYTEDAALNLNDIAISDVDSATVTATLTLSNTSAGSLNTATSGAVSSAYNAGTGVWTASGAVANVNTLLAGLTFTPEANFNSSFTIATSINDGTTTLTGTKTMTGTAVNDAPIVISNSNMLASIDEDVLNPNGASVLSLFGANFLDSADSLNLEHNQFAGIAVRSQNTTNFATEGRWQYSIDNGSSWNNFIAVSNSAAISLGLNDLLRFLPAENFNGLTDVITARLIDNSVTVTSGNTINVNTNGGVTAYSSSFVSLATRVNAINDAPTATNLSAPETYTEDTALDLSDIVISDIDSATVTATLTLSNAAAGSLNTATSGAVTSTYNSGTGEWTASGAVADVNTLLAGLTFTPASNFNSSFTIATSVSDGEAAAVTGTKTMTGTAVNDAPTATNLSATETYTEDTALNLTDIVISDIDIDSATVTATLTLSNAAAGSLNTATSGAVTSFYNSGTGEWTASGALADVNTLLAGLIFTPSANFNSSFTIATSINDGTTTLTGTKAMTCAVVNDAPVLSNLSNTVSHTEGGSSTVLALSVAVTDAELSSANNFNDATLTLARNGGPNSQDALAFDGINVTASGANVYVGGVQVGTYTFTSGQMVVTFGTNATQARVNTLMQNIVYWNTSDNPPGSVQIDWTFSDGNTGSQGTGGALTATGSTIVTITPINDVSVNAMPSGLTVNEDGTLTLSGISITDPDSGSSILRTTLSVNQGTLAATTDGLVTVVGSGTDSITLIGTLANLNAYLAGASKPTYTDALDASGTVQLSIVTSDGQNSGTGGAIAAGTFDYRFLDGAPAGSNPDNIASIGGLTGVATDFNAGSLATSLTGSSTTFGIVYTGVINVTTAGTYNFTVAADDAATLYIDGTFVLLSWFSAGTANSLSLGAGQHSIELRYAQDSGGSGLSVSYSGPDTGAVSTPLFSAPSVGRLVSQTATTNITVTAVNDAPTATNLNAAETYIEDTALNLTDIVVSEVDSATVTATLILSNAAAGSLNTATSGAITSTYNSSTGVWAANGAVSDINVLLAGLTFTPSANFNSNFAINTSITDGIAVTSGTKTMTGTAVNDAPVIANLESTTVNFVEGDLATQITNALTLTDVDNTVLTGATITLSSGFIPGEDTLTFANTSNITGSWDATTGVLSLTGTDTIAAYQAALRTVKYIDLNTEPTPGNLTLTLSVNDGSAASNVVIRQILVTATNDTSIISAASLTLDEGSTVTLSNSNFSITDPDNTNFTYSVSNVSGGYFQLSSATGVAISSFTSAQLAGSLVQFVDDGNELAPSFDVTVNDGSVNSNTVTASISFSSVNDAPVNTIYGDGSVLPEETSLQLLGSISITDPDADSGTYAVSLSVTPAAGVLSASSGVGVTISGSGTHTLILSGTLASINSYFNNATFAPIFTAVADFNGAVSFTVTTNDNGNTGAGGAKTDIDVIHGSISAVSDITNDNYSTNEDTAITFSPLSNDSFENGTKYISQINGSNISVGELISITGGTLTVDSLNTLTFTPSANFHGSPSFNYTVAAGGAFETTTVNLTVNSIADTPSVTNANTIEDTQTTSGLVITRNVSDDNTVTHFKITGITGGTLYQNDGSTVIAEGDYITVAQGNSGLKFTPVNNSNTNGSFNVQASVASDDSGLGGGLATATITINAVNDAPLLSHASLTLSEGQTVTLSGSNFGITDPDNNTFTVSVSAVSGGYFQLSTAAGLTVTSFTSVQLNAGQVQFVDDGNEVAPSFDVTINDGNLNSNTLSATINYTSVNDTPVLTSVSLTIIEGTTMTLSAANFGITDPDNGNFIVTVSSVIGGQFELTSSSGMAVTSFTTAQLNAGSVQFVDDGNEDAPSFDVTINDGVVDSNMVSATINYTAANDTPVLNSASLTLIEGTTVTLTAANFGISDPDNSNFTVTVSSVNGGQFELSSSPGVAVTSFTTVQLNTGIVRFVDDGNEVSPSFDVIINDGVISSNSLSASINYTLANDAPVLTSASLSVIEGATVTLSAANFGITDPDNSNFTFTVSNVSGGQFELTSSPGVAVTSFTTAQLNTAIVRFVDDGNEVAPSFDVMVNDGVVDSNILSATINYTVANDAPVLIYASLTVIEGQTVNLSGANFGITDPDNSSFTFTVSSVNGGIFQLSSNPGVTISSFTSAQLTNGEVQFVDDGNEVAPSFDVTVNDGMLHSNMVSASINFTSTNDTPVLTSASITLSEGGTVILSDANFIFSDPDNSNFTYTVSSVTGGIFQLSTNPGVAIFSFTNSELSGGQVEFIDDGNEIAPSFDVKVNDGAVDSNLVQATIHYSSMNDAPVNSGLGVGLIGAEDTTIQLLGSISIVDVDDISGIYTVTLSVQAEAGILTANSGGSVTVSGSGSNSLTFSGSLSAINSYFANAGTAPFFTPVADFNGVASFTVTTVDDGYAGNGGAQSDSDTFNLSINAVNDIVNDSVTTDEDTSISFTPLSNDNFENSNRSISHINGTVIVLGQSVTVAGGTVTFNLGNTLTFTPNANYAGNLSFDYTVTSGGTIETASIHMTVDPIADTPAVSNATTDEDTQTTTGLVISHNNADGNEVTHFKITGITGGTLYQNNGTTVIHDDDFITYAEGNAGLTFLPYTNSISSGSFNIQASLSASNAGLGGGIANANITVNPLNDAPIIANLHGDSLTYLEDSGPINIEQGLDAVVNDIDSTNFDGGTLSVSFISGSVSSDDVLAIRHQGLGAGQIGISGSVILYGGLNIASFSGGTNSSPLVISLNNNATAARLNALIQNVTYENTNIASPTEGARSVRFVLADGDGGTSDNFDTFITVNGVNDIPVFGGMDSGNVQEDVSVDVDGLIQFSGAMTISDADTGESSFISESITGVYGTLNIAANGSWNFSAMNNHSAIQHLDINEILNDSFSISSTDGSQHALLITIQGAEDAPVISGSYTGTVSEDRTFSVSGSLLINDTDSHDNPLSFVDMASAPGANGYGNFVLSNNSWGYSLNNSNAAVQALGAGESLTDTFTFSATDGSTQTVMVVITGSNEVETLSKKFFFNPISDVFDRNKSINQSVLTSKIVPPVFLSASENREDSQTHSISNLSDESQPITDLDAYVDQLISGISTDGSLLSNDFQGENLDYSVMLQTSKNENASLENNFDKQFQHHQLDKAIRPQLNQAKVEFNSSLLQESQVNNDENLMAIDENVIWDRINKIRNEMDQSNQEDPKQMEVQIVLGTTVSLTAGFVSWILRGGSLLASFLSTVPLFNRFDPLPILRTSKKKQAVDPDKENNFDEIFGNDEISNSLDHLPESEVEQ